VEAQFASRFNGAQLTMFNRRGQLQRSPDCV